MHHLLRRAFFPLYLLLVAAVGCGEDPAPSPRDAGSSPSADAGATDAVASGASALYAIHATTFSADFSSRSSYLAVVPSLAPDTTIDYAKVATVGGTMEALPGSGEVFVYDAEKVQLRKYTVDSSGTVTPGMTLGLSGLGVSAMSVVYLRIVSPSKGYIFDTESLQLAAFDARAMTLGKVTTLTALKNPAGPAYVGLGTGTTRGDQLVLLVYYADLKNETTPRVTPLVFVNTATDEAKVVLDERCGGLAYTARGPDGALYAASDAWAAGLHRLGRSPAPCMLRVLPGQDAFDPTYKVDLNTLSGGKPTGGLVEGPDGTGFLRVLDEGVFMFKPDTTGRQPFSAVAWRTLRIDLGKDTAPTAITKPELTAGGLTWFSIDGRSYANDSAANFSETTLVEMTKDGAAPGIKVRGVPFSVVRVR
jgi:hypothetical protein